MDAPSGNAWDAQLQKIKNESVEIDSPISFGGGYVARIGFVVIDGVNILFWFYYRERDEN